jgi:predicted secreted hydrolase
METVPEPSPPVQGRVGPALGHSRGRRRVLSLALAPLAGLPLVRRARAAVTGVDVRAAVEYPDVRAGRALAFPADFGAHPRFRVEWWYVTGWIDSPSYGFQLTFFRVRPGVAEDNPSRFAPKQLLFGHAALADPVLERLRVAQRAAREGFGLAGASEDTTRVWIGDWSLVRNAAAYRAVVRAPDFAFELALAPTQPVLVEGDGGVSSKGPDPREASFYYSEPQLAVHGTVTVEGRTREVDGTAWLDHEWSSDYLGRGAVGWDWTGVNFDDGSALMAFRIRGAAGKPTWAGATLRDASGRRTTFGPADVAFTALRRWTSPRTRIDYPVAMDVRAGGLEVTLEPLFDDQELDARASIGTVYWEGAVRARIAGRVAGRGYLELTGYGAPLRL